MTTGILYGCVILHTFRTVFAQEPYTPIEFTREYIPFTFPFSDLEKLDKGNHFGPFSEKVENVFDYWMGGIGVESSKLSAPSRGVTISGMRVGDNISDSVANLTHKIIYSLLTINSDSTDEDKSLPYLDLVYSKVSKNLQGRWCATFDISSSKSKFVIMSKDVPLYLFTFSDDEATYLMWTNEESLRQRMREHYGEQFYYYNLGTLKNGTLVLQSYYLRRIYQKWRKNLKDKLKIMNALEEYISKKTITDTSVQNHITENSRDVIVNSSVSNINNRSE